LLRPRATRPDRGMWGVAGAGECGLDSTAVAVEKALVGHFYIQIDYF